MSMAVYEPHHGMFLVAPVDDADGSRVKPDAEGRGGRRTHSSAKQHFDRANMRNQYNSLIWMRRRQLFNGCAYTLLHLGKAFSTWRGNSRIPFPCMQL